MNIDRRKNQHPFRQRSFQPRPPGTPHSSQRTIIDFGSNSSDTTSFLHYMRDASISLDENYVDFALQENNDNIWDTTFGHTNLGSISSTEALNHPLPYNTPLSPPQISISHVLPQHTNDSEHSPPAMGSSKCSKCRKKQRCGVHITRLRNLPGTACVRCKAIKKQCDGVPCPRCSKANLNCSQQEIKTRAFTPPKNHKIRPRTVRNHVEVDDFTSPLLLGDQSLGSLQEPLVFEEFVREHHIPGISMVEGMIGIPNEGIQPMTRSAHTPRSHSIIEANPMGLFQNNIEEELPHEYNTATRLPLKPYEELGAIHDKYAMQGHDMGQLHSNSTWKPEEDLLHHWLVNFNSVEMEQLQRFAASQTLGSFCEDTWAEYEKANPLQDARTVGICKAFLEVDGHVERQIFGDAVTGDGEEVWFVRRNTHQLGSLQ